jgi:hypothetical protein
VLLGLLLLIVPGGIVWAGLFVAMPVLVSEPKRTASEALRRSWELTRGFRLPVFVVGLVSLVAFVAGIVLLGLASELFFGEESRVGALICELLLIPITGVFYSAPAVAYHDLLREREGADPSQLGAVFE